MRSATKKLIFLLIMLTMLVLPCYSQENGEEQTDVVAQQAILSYRAGDYESSIKYFKMLGIDYLKPNDYLLLANSYDSLGKSDYAKKVLETLVLKFPNSYEGYYNFGRLHYKDGNFEKAISCFEQSKKLNPKFAYSYYNLGNCYYCLKKYKKAISCYKKALKLAPELKEAKENIELTVKIQKNSKFFF